jgi:hypothetical protein
MGALVIGLSGKKQSGKNTVCDNIVDHLLKNFDISKGIKIFSFADTLKQKVCIDILGLSNEQCNGTNEQKNSITKYRWEKLPQEIQEKNYKKINEISNKEDPISSGYMSAREVMQIVGTDIFRHYFDDNIWVKATFREINRVNPDVAIVPDLRFPSEVEGVLREGGFIIRLLRNVCEGDGHESETALDNYDFYSLGEDRVYVLDNREMTIDQQKNVVISKIDFIASKKLRRIFNVS